jgi:hypothetical protein
MYGNIGGSLGTTGNTQLRALPGSSPNSTGTNMQAVSAPATNGVRLPPSSPPPFAYNPNFGLKPGAPAPNGAPLLQAPGNISATFSPTSASSTHASGLPNQPPSGINPQLWSSVLQHLQQTNFGKSTAPQSQMPTLQRPPQTPMMNTQPRTGGFMGAF